MSGKSLKVPLTKVRGIKLWVLMTSHISKNQKSYFPFQIQTRSCEETSHAGFYTEPIRKPSIERKKKFGPQSTGPQIRSELNPLGKT